MAHILFFIIFLPVAGFSLILDRFGRACLLFFAFFVFVCIFVFSYKMGVDWYLYENSYYENGLRSTNPDFLYKQLTSFFSWIGVSHDLFSSLNRLAYAFFVFWVIRKYTSYGLLAFIAIFASSFIFMNDQLRQQIAAIFCVLAILGAHKGLFRFFSLVIVGSFFHAAAVCVIPIWFFYRSNFLIFSAFAVGFAFFILSYFGFGLVWLVKYIWFYIFGSEGLVAYKLMVYSSAPSSDFSFSHVVRFVIFLIYFFIYYVMYYRGRGGRAEFSQDNILRCFFIGAFFMVFYELIFYDVETVWRRLKEFFVIFFIMYPIILLERYAAFGWRTLGFFMILFYSGYLSFNFLSSDFFLNNYGVYNNYFYSLISAGRDEDAYKRVTGFWELWSPAGGE